MPWRKIATRRPPDPSITPVNIGTGPVGATNPVPPRTAPLPVGGNKVANSAGGEKMSRVGSAALAAPLGKAAAGVWAVGTAAYGAGPTGGKAAGIGG